MIAFLKRLVTPPPVEKIIANQLYEAERSAIEHEAAAEHHHALADMYRSRATRLRGKLQGDPQ